MGENVPVHATKTNTGGAKAGIAPLILNLGERTSRSGRFAPEKELQDLLNRRLGESNSRSGRLREQKNL